MCMCDDTMLYFLFCCFFFFKQKTAYEMRISDWSSDVCSSDLLSGNQAVAAGLGDQDAGAGRVALDLLAQPIDMGLEGVGRDPGIVAPDQIGRASCRERVCQYV